MNSNYSDHDGYSYVAAFDNAGSQEPELDEDDVRELRRIDLAKFLDRRRKAGRDHLRPPRKQKRGRGR